MRTKKLPRAVWAPDEIIGHFGKVRLVRKSDGRHQLTGGTVDDRAAVRKWCKRFATFLVLAEAEAEESVLTA